MSNPFEQLEIGIEYERAGVLDKALKHYGEVAETAQDPALVAEALRRKSGVYRNRSAWDQALECARKSGESAERAGLPDLLAEAVNAEALVHQSRGDFGTAVPLLERVLELTEDDRIRGIALQNLGSIAATAGDLELAEQRFHDSWQCFDRAIYLRGAVIALNNYATIAILRGNYESAETICERAVIVAKEIQDLDLVGVATMNYAQALAGLEEWARAGDFASAAYGYFCLVQNTWRQVECLRLLGDIHAKHGRTDMAIHCYQQGLDAAKAVGARVEESELSDRLATILSS